MSRADRSSTQPGQPGQAPQQWPGRPIGRREVLALGIGAFVVASVPLVRRFGRSRPLIRRSLPVMGTIADLAVVHDDPALAHAALDAAFAELVRVDRSMTRFRDDSDVGRANRLAARQAVRVHPETGRVLKTALDWARLSDGRFDPMLGSAVELWDVAHREEPPPRQAVRQFAGRALFRSLQLTELSGAAEVAFRDPDARLDLGGIAKGYGVDCAVAALRAAGIQDGLVNVGGDLYALGRSEDGDPWTVGIRSPDDPAVMMKTLRLGDRAVATSGDYEQYFMYAGRRYHHLLDPRTAAPRETDDHSLTITAASCIQADAAATALFGDSEANIRRLLDRAGADLSLA